MEESVIQGIIGEELLSLRDRIINNHIASGQRASGRTIESMTIETTATSGVLFARRAVGTLETGRKGGVVPKGFNEIIRLWIMDKGIHAAPIPYVREASSKWQPKYTPEERGYMSLAGAIAHKIASEGTSLYRQGGRKDIYSNEIMKTLKSLSDRLVGVVGLKIDTINNNAVKDDNS